MINRKQNQHPTQSLSGGQRVEARGSGRISLTFLPFLLCSLSFPNISAVLLPANAAELPNNSEVTNVRAYGAKGDGKTDDTEAIREALAAGKRFVYLPEGIYLVCDTIKIPQPHKRYFFEGESRDKTIIKLQDNCPGFDNSEKPKPVISTEGTPGQAFRNSVFDLTVDVGRGNPGAIGIEYLTNNQGTIRNVTIKSSDPERRGNTGLALTLPWPGPGTIKDVQIIGFDYGIKATFPEFGMVFEDIALQNQRIAGIENSANLLSIRGLNSENSVPVIRNTDGRGLVVILDSDFRGGSPSQAAIENRKGVLYARNIKASGYRAAIKNGRTVVSGNEVSEYVSKDIYSLFPSSETSLHLPVEETPTVPYGDFKDWVSVTEYGADGGDEKDDTQAIQQAINSGRSTVYFPKGRYIISQTLNVGGNVSRITGLESTFTVKSPLNGQEKPVFRFEDGNQNVVILERFWGDYGGKEFHWVEHGSSQTLVLRNIAVGSGRAYRNTGSGRLFVEDVVASDWVFNQQQVWARQINPEGDGTKIVNNGGTLWILGLKTEDEGTAIKTIAGGKTEVLGGLLYPGSGNIPDDQPAFLNDESQLSVVIAESHHGGARYKTFVKETRNGASKALMARDLPRRGSARVIPLYVGNPGDGSEISAASVDSPSLLERLKAGFMALLDPFIG
jgi:hypothetical protein